MRPAAGDELDEEIEDDAEAGEVIEEDDDNSGLGFGG